MQTHERRIEQVGHGLVAAGRGIAAQHDPDQPGLVAHDRGRQVEPRRPHVAGLQAVGAGVTPQQIVVVGGGGALIGEGGGGEVAIVLREIPDQCDGQIGHIPGRGVLVAVMQPRRIAKGGAVQPQIPGPHGHAHREITFGSSQSLRQHHGGVVGGFRHQGQNRVFNRDRLAGQQPHLRGHLTGGGGGNRQRLGQG